MEQPEDVRFRSRWFLDLNGADPDSLVPRRRAAFARMNLLHASLVPDRKTWKPVPPGQMSGRIKSLAIHPTNGRVLFAGAANGGVWKSVNGGRAWYPTMEREESLAIGGLAVAPGNPTVLYAATGEYTPGWGASYPGAGVYRSSDGGESWIPASGTILSLRCVRVLVSPASENTVYVAGNAGLHRSTDGGATWQDVRDDRISDVVLDPERPETLYAGAWRKGVYKSEDAGLTWRLLDDGLPVGYEADWIKLAMGWRGHDRTDFLAAKMGPSSADVYVSTNAGAKWERRHTFSAAIPHNEWTSVIAVHPRNQDVILAGDKWLFFSDDGGWSFSPTTGTHEDHHQVVFDHASRCGRRCYVATDGGVFRSADAGRKWFARSTGLATSQFYAIGVSQNAADLLGGTTQDEDIVLSRTPGDWKLSSDGEGGPFVVDPNDSCNLYIMPRPGILRRSSDGGRLGSWTTINTLGSPAPEVVDVAVRPGRGSSRFLVAIGTDCPGSKLSRPRLFHSADSGASWSVAHELLLGNVGTRVAFSPSQSDFVYATTEKGLVFRSDRGGAEGTWSEPYSPGGSAPPQGRILTLAIDGSNPLVVYIGYAGYDDKTVYRSDDGGETWSDAGGPEMRLPEVPVTGLVTDPDRDSVVYAATAMGVYRSENRGLRWAYFSEGMPHVLVTSLALRKVDRVLYASTMGRGLYRRQL